MFLCYLDEEGFHSIASLHCVFFSFSFSLSPGDIMFCPVYSPVVIGEGFEG